MHCPNCLVPLISDCDLTYIMSPTLDFQHLHQGSVPMRLFGAKCGRSFFSRAIMKRAGCARADCRGGVTMTVYPSGGRASSVLSVGYRYIRMRLCWKGSSFCSDSRSFFFDSSLFFLVVDFFFFRYSSIYVLFGHSHLSFTSFFPTAFDMLFTSRSLIGVSFGLCLFHVVSGSEVKTARPFFLEASDLVDASPECVAALNSTIDCPPQLLFATESL